MSTVISKNEFINYDGKSMVELKDLSVEIYKGEDPKLERVPLSNLFVKVNGKVRKVKSYNEFIKHLKNDNVFTSENALQSIRHRLSKVPEVQIKGVNVPDNYTSIVINSQKPDEVVPYGLKRNLKVELADSSVPTNERYYFLEINGKEGFLKLNDLYFYDKTNKKRLLSDKNIDIDKLQDVQIFASNGMKVSRIYTEKQYVFPTVNASEKVDVDKFEKTTFSVETQEEDGNISTQFKSSKKSLDRYFSEQKFVKKQIEDENRPGKTKEVNLIEVRNFQMQADGDYYSVVLDGLTKMVHKDNILDIEGKKVEDFLSMAGKSVQIKENGQIIGTSQPLSYEQANFAYSSIKTYQETKEEAGENTYLRLKNGEYVKELDVCKPISYKIVSLTNAPYDAFLVKSVGVDGKENFVVVSKDYFDKYGDTTEFKRENAVRISRCDFDNKDCAVVQTTSRGLNVEKCAIVKKTKILGKQVTVEESDKNAAFDIFKASFANGTYLLKDVIKDNNIEELSIRKQRYELTDKSYLPDYADYLYDYNSLKTEDIKIVNGKLVGGPKFSVKKGIKSSFKKLNKMAGPLAFVWGGAGILIPVVGPIISAAIVATYVAAVPFIPMYNGLRGLTKNMHRTKLLDKTDYNQLVEKIKIEKRMKQLYERMTSNEVTPLSKARFEDEYNKLLNDIISLSTGSFESALVVKNGVAKVTPDNAAAAKQYMIDFKRSKKAQEIAEKNTKKVQEDFYRTEKLVKKFEDEGIPIPIYLEMEYNRKKSIYENNKQISDAATSHFESLKNYVGHPKQLVTHVDRDRLLKVASVMKTAVYFKSSSFKDHPLVQEALYGKNGINDCTDLLTEEDLALDDKNWTQEEIDEYRKNYANQSMKMLKNMEMDFKNGLMVDGIGVGLSDEALSRTPEYARGYQWAKVKQAIEFVHNGLNTNKTELKNSKDKEVPKPEPEENKKEKTKTSRLNKVVITSENSVAQQLENQESKYYKDVIKSLTRKGGKFEMSKEDAAVAIFDFTTKVNNAHADKKHAKDVFEKGSVDAYILNTVTKSMSKGATLDYQTSKQAEEEKMF